MAYTYTLTQSVIDSLATDNIDIEVRDDLGNVLTISDGLPITQDYTITLTVSGNFKFQTRSIGGGELDGAYIRSYNANSSPSSAYGVFKYVNGNVQKVSYVFKDSDFNNDPINFVTYLEAYTPPTYEYIIDQTDVDTAIANNATFEIVELPDTPIPFEVGAVLKAGRKITMVADVGYVATDFYYEYGEKLLFGAFIQQGLQRISFVEDLNDPRKAHYEWNNSDFTGNPSGIVALTAEEGQETVVRGTNKVFKIDIDDLKMINNVRIVTDTNGTRDYGKYILSVLDLPFSIDPELILENELINLADFQTPVSAPVIFTDFLRVDMGEITIVGDKGNLLDYKNVSAVLHLPKSQSVFLDLDYVIDQTISVEYLIDCYTGVAQINVSSSKIDGVIHTQKSTIGVNIPYASDSTGDDNLLSNQNIQVGGDNGITKPYIELRKTDNDLVNGMFTIPVKKEGDLTNETGFVRVEQIEFNSIVRKQEIEEIVRILNSGVIIK